MELLQGTPYLLDPTRALQLLRYVEQLQEEVHLLRRRGHLDQRTLEQLRREWGVQNVYESAGIEGNQLTLSETRMAIQRGITISGKPPEHSAEVRNLHEAHEYLESLANSADPVSEREVREVQGLIVGREEIDSGAYRSINVEISGAAHTPPIAIKVPEMMRECMSWFCDAHSGAPTLLRAAIFHAWFTHIHPFRDGNGRTARAITNLLLIREGYPILVIRRKDRQRYYEALRLSDDGDLSALVELMTDRIQDSLRQIDRVRTAVSQINIALEKVREQDERKYRIWLDGMRLFVSTLEDAFKQVEAADGAFSVAVQHYDLPSSEDFREICLGNPSGNTWLVRFRVSRNGVAHAILLWVGFSSDVLTHSLGLESRIPAIKISEPNPLPPPPWRPPSASFPGSAREFAYHGGKYMRVLDDSTVQPVDSALELAGTFVGELLVGWFATPSHEV